MADPTDLPQTDPRGPDPSQLSTFLPSTTVFITGHDEAGKSRVHESRSSKWTPFDDKKMAMTTVYSNEAQPDFNDDADLKTAQEDSTTLRSLVKRGGTVIRQVGGQSRYDGLVGLTCIGRLTCSQATRPSCIARSRWTLASWWRANAR